MKIEILGTGCPKCKKLYEHAEQALKETGINAELKKVTDIKEIMNNGVMITPALAIDGKIKSAGKIPSVEEIKNWLTK
ncbi:MAG: thioredoxin family protein [bacterium]